MSRIFLIAIVVAGIGVLAWHGLKNGFLDNEYLGLIGTSSTTTAQTLSYTYEKTSEDTIFVTTPKPGAMLAGTIIVKGYARGQWYFEGVFPVEVKNRDGLVIGASQGRADTDWMREGFVPFTAEIVLKAPYTGSAVVILKNDNPSGKPENEKSISIPIILQ